MKIYKEMYGKKGQIVLNAWCGVDPLELSFPTEELDKKKYLNYGIRFMTQFGNFMQGYHCYTERDITEMVRRSFSIRQIVEKNKFIDLGAIDLIAGRIFIDFTEEGQ